MKRSPVLPIGLLAAGLIASLASAPLCAQPIAATELVDLSLEELANIEITSVSRRAERVQDAAASVYVITHDMLRRGGATSLPEALRLAPNLQVARMDAHQYAISARGFNNAVANKLLVLIDGRTVYAPFFSGVFWDQQDVMLDDVERIEVISGPGATLWGANAVNGVINVITKAAKDSSGLLASAAAGNREASAALRYGGRLSNGTQFRVYAKSLRQAHTETDAGVRVNDGMQRSQLGFRADWGDAARSFTLQGDAYSGKTDARGSFLATALTPVQVSGANLLARWTQALDGGASLRVQAYYDHTRRDDVLLYSPRASIADLEVQHSLPLGAHKLVWGGGYRQARDEIRPGLFFGFSPNRDRMDWKNLFVQDDIELSQNVDLTLGAKAESNVYTGWELLPSARLAWTPSDKQLVWGAVSRAVRAPARLDRDLRLPAKPPFIIAGGPDFVSEVANVFELGYRAQSGSDLSYSVTAFRHVWDKLRSGQTPPNAMVQNMIKGSSHGIEAWGVWQARPHLRLSGGYTALRKNLRLLPGSTDPDGAVKLGNDPEQQWTLRAAFSLTRRQELDLSLRRVGALPNPAVPAYTALDLRYARLLRKDLELALSAQNLLDRGHVEFNDLLSGSEIRRSVQLQLRWTQ
jgi:iron complex outermembrane receptor protein